MAIPKLKKQDIIDALKYIDEHGIPSQNESAKYKLVTDAVSYTHLTLPTICSV